MPDESKKLSPASTTNSKPATPPTLSKDQVKGLLIDFMDKLAATKPPAAKQQAEMRDLGFMPPDHPYLKSGTTLVGVTRRKPDADATPIQITDESDMSTPDKSEEPAFADVPRSSDKPQDANTTSKSPNSNEKIIHGVRFVKGSNPCPSSQLLPNWSSGPRKGDSVSDNSEESKRTKEPRSSETTTETQPNASATSKSPHLKEETLHGVRFVNESNPCPSSELLPNWSPKRRS